MAKKFVKIKFITKNDEIIREIEERNVERFIRKGWRLVKGSETSKSKDSKKDKSKDSKKDELDV